jgi:hypothetical protein
MSPGCKSVSLTVNQKWLVCLRKRWTSVDLSIEQRDLRNSRDDYNNLEFPLFPGGRDDPLSEGQA